MANIKASCIRKGVVAGRIAANLNELYTQISVLEDVDIYVSKEAITEISKSLGSLKRNFRSAAAEVQEIDESTRKISKALRSAADPTVRQELKTELQQMQTNFRKVLKAGYTDCGSSKADPHDIARITDDNAFYTDKAD